MFTPKSETEDLLLSDARNGETLIEQTLYKMTKLHPFQKIEVAVQTREKRMRLTMIKF